MEKDGVGEGGREADESSWQPEIQSKNLATLLGALARSMAP